MIPTSVKRLLLRTVAGLALLPCLVVPAQAGVLIDRMITVDGTFTDWDGTGGTYDPPGNILTNTDQYGTDCQNGNTCDLDSPFSSSGRDLKKFAFTWDDTYIYFYVERWDSGSNVTDWWFHMDTDGDNLMETGEKVMRVNWKGSNRTTAVSVWDYTASAGGGDPMISGGTSDGYDMPGAVSGETSIYTGVIGGSSTGYEMESRLAWTSLGASGPTNMNFHVSSSNGTNLPGNTIDNVQGPGANQLFPSDIRVQKSASVSTISANQTFTYTVTVTNTGYQTFTGVTITDVLPADVTYLSHTTLAGTYDDTNANLVPDLWTIGTLTPQQTVTLTITVRAANVTATTNATNTATLSTYAGAVNFFTANDTASVVVSITPSPLLNVTKFASDAIGPTSTATPGTIVRYNAYISNIGYAVATAVVIIDKFSEFTAFRLDTFGAGQHVQFTQGSPSSALTMGTPTFSNNGGATYTYVPVSGGGGAPTGYDANVTHMRVPMTGSMPGSSANFTITYHVIVE